MCECLLSTLLLIHGRRCCLFFPFTNELLPQNFCIYRLFCVIVRFVTHRFLRLCFYPFFGRLPSNEQIFPMRKSRTIKSCAFYLNFANNFLLLFLCVWCERVIIFHRHSWKYQQKSYLSRRTDENKRAKRKFSCCLDDQLSWVPKSRWFLLRRFDAHSKNISIFFLFFRFSFSCLHWN